MPRTRSAPNRNVRRDDRVGLRLWLIVVAGALAYANSLAGPFILDDIPTIVGNQSIRSVSALRTVLTPPRGLPVAGRPLVNLSFAVNYAIGGVDVFGYHLVNVIVHLLCAVVLFGIVRRTLTLRPVPRLQARAADLALATALIWVLHPLNTDAVDYVTQRTESMMALFYLSTLYCSIRAQVGPAKAGRHVRWAAGAVVSCALGMACKESMVTAPIVVALYDRIFLFESWRDALRVRGRLYSALAATWVVLAVLVWSGPRGHSAGLSTGVTPATYLANQAVFVVRYLQLAIWPRALVVNYGVPHVMTTGDVLPGAAVVIAVLLATALALATRPAVGFLGAWVIVTLAPTSTIIPIATEVAAERRMYLPLAALAALAVVVSEELWHRGGRARFSRVAGVTVLASVAALLGARTVLRNQEYTSALRLAQTVVDRTGSGVGHAMVGEKLAAAGRTEEAVAELRLAVRDHPLARYALGRALFDARRFEEAAAELRTFVHEQPELLEVLSARMLIGRALIELGQHMNAVAEFEEVLRLVPSYNDAHGGLADALFALEEYERAAVHYREFLTRHPTDLAALTKLGVAHVSAGHADEAVPLFRRAVELNPGSEEARRNLANALEDARAGAVKR
jgi:tetratricopeptide (TPR) repeat protein